jgi:2-polyprenyl-3-methyl-5-hydroxy-6-metoxy-1,4-benzoquinol methylase
VQSGAATRQTFEQIGPIDAIVMPDVIEHLENPGSVLQLCAEYRRLGGLFCPDRGFRVAIHEIFSGKR